jgi:ankyrin repeat protein
VDLLHPLSGESLLLYACRMNAIKCTKLLLRAGAQFDPTNSLGRNALHVAAANSSVACVLELLRVSSNTPGHTELILSLTDADGDTTLHIACKLNHDELVRKIVKTR